MRLKQLVPPSVKPALVNVANRVELLTRRGVDEMIPPRRLAESIGAGDFEQTGQEFLRHFIELGHLRPSETVLEVGCGCGRMAVPLTKYLTGRYEGFDVTPAGIKWCQERITPKHPNFHFELADVYNHSFNPKGRYGADQYRFPYPDHTFDFVFLTSVFTHLLPADLTHYFSEVFRVLKDKGRCLVTFFLLNEESLTLISEGSAAMNFGYGIDGCRVNDPEYPEAAIAYPEKFIIQLFESFSTEIRYGSWCGRKEFLSFQDIIIASSA